MPPFEFDPAKSAANAAKHGIDFVEAQAIWDDPDLVDAGVTQRGDEERRIIVGNIDDIVWTSIFTYREDRIRIISVRRARPIERQDYYNRGV